jgi:hypothetical protein
MWSLSQNSGWRTGRYHRILRNAVVTSVKIVIDKALLKSIWNCGRFCGVHSLQTMVVARSHKSDLWR